MVADLREMQEKQGFSENRIDKPGFRNAFTTALCAVFKKEFLKHGGFDEKYFNAWEGMELGLKIVSSGGKCYYNPEAKAFHIRGGGRGQYKIDETPQTAYFWSKWGNVINENLSQVINAQLCDNDKDLHYKLVNFSCIRDFEYITSKMNLDVTEFLNYTEYAGYDKIEFFKILPYSLLDLDCNIIYLSNNYTNIINNSLWFSLRNKNNDIIIDLSGNCLKPLP